MKEFSDRGSGSPEELEAKCDYMKICSGKILSFDQVEKAHEDHEITILGNQSSAIFGFPSDSATSKEVKVTERAVMIIPAGRSHTVKWSPHAERTTMLIGPTFLRSLAIANGFPGFTSIQESVSTDLFIWHLGRALEVQMRTRTTMETSYLEAAATVIGQHLLSVHTTTAMADASFGGLPRSKLKLAIDFVRARYRDDIGFRDIARELGMSPFHFARMFRHSTGESPHQFIMRCRIDGAKKLLSEEDMAIADVAFEVGYKSQSYFTTRFAQLVGTTPAVFRATR